MAAAMLRLGWNPTNFEILSFPSWVRSPCLCALVGVVAASLAYSPGSKGAGFSRGGFPDLPGFGRLFLFLWSDSPSSWLVLSPSGIDLSIVSGLVGCCFCSSLYLWRNCLFSLYYWVDLCLCVSYEQWAPLSVLLGLRTNQAWPDVCILSSDRWSLTFSTRMQNLQNSCYNSSFPYVFARVSTC